MDRIEALQNVKAKTEEFFDYLQGGYCKKEGLHEVDIATDCHSSDEVDALACACEVAIDWMNSEIVKEEKEIEERESEEDPRDMMDETGHKDGDF